MGKKLGRNPHQKRAHRVGEQRIGTQELQELLVRARSAAADDRLEAARLLCPCHVRRRLEPVWQALYGLLQDPDVRVRRAAWHTLDDGGRPDDPTLDRILDQALREERDPQVLAFARKFAAPRQQRARVLDTVAVRPERKERGRCDFCGAAEVPVTRDLETMIPTGDLPRPARVCDRCAELTS